MTARLIVVYTLIGASLIVAYAHMVAHVSY
jgi:hypothetical protein